MRKPLLPASPMVMVRWIGACAAVRVAECALVLARAAEATLPQCLAARGAA